MNVTAVHHKSNELSDEAFISQRKGHLEPAKILYEKAFWLEKAAALAMEEDDIIPVPKPVMMRSAASLAYKAGLYQEAEKLIALCRSKKMPPFILRELKELEELIEKEKPTISSRSFKIKGKLTSANENENENEILVEEEETQTPYFIFIPTGKIKEVVRKYFSEIVQVQADKSLHGVFMLKKISKAA